MTKLVLAIDDDKYVHHVVESSLSGFCNLIHAKNGEEGFNKALKYTPDIILLDVEMPGKSGYQVCQELKTNTKTKDIPVMFLSGRGELSERVKGYNLGAADYIVKPFESEELMARIRVLYDYSQHSLKLKDEVERAHNTAELAMTDSGDMGRIMRYVGQSYHANDLQSLSGYFFDFFRPLNLDVIVAFWYQETGIFCSDDGAVCPLEQDLLEKHRYANRFVDFSRRTIVNYPKVSILVKNMPLDDERLYGRYKDLFPHILDVTNAKIQDMDASESALTKALSLNNALAELSSQIHSLGDDQKLFTTKLVAQLEDVHKYSLEQSESVKSQTQNFNSDSLTQTQSECAALNDDVSFITFQFNQVIELSNELVQSLKKEIPPEQIKETASQIDIELF